MLDSSLKRHTALIKRAKLSIGVENRDQILKDIETLVLEKYVEEISTSLLEGLGRCKTDKDIWAATEVLVSIEFLGYYLLIFLEKGHLCRSSSVRACVHPQIYKHVIASVGPTSS